MNSTLTIQESEYLLDNFLNVDSAENELLIAALRDLHENPAAPLSSMPPILPSQVKNVIDSVGRTAKKSAGFIVSVSGALLASSLAAAALNGVGPKPVVEFAQSTAKSIETITKKVLNDLDFISQDNSTNSTQVPTPQPSPSVPELRPISPSPRPIPSTSPIAEPEVSEITEPTAEPSQEVSETSSSASPKPQPLPTPSESKTFIPSPTPAPTVIPAPVPTPTPTPTPSPTPEPIKNSPSPQPESHSPSPSHSEPGSTPSKDATPSPKNGDGIVRN